MKRIIWLIFFSWFALNVVDADQFRIRGTRNGNTFDFSYATVRIAGASSSTSAFDGKTDRYGRITINLPSGRYEAEVIRGNMRVKVDLVLDGQRNLKAIIVK